MLNDVPIVKGTLDIVESYEGPFIYLAAPYSSTDKKISEERYELITKLASGLVASGNIVYSPVTHTHPMASIGKFPTGYHFWKKLDSFYLERCDILMVYQLAGWEESIGVKSEIESAMDKGKQIIFMPNIEVKSYDISSK